MSSILFIGGSGEISQACVTEAVRLGHQVSVFNRGKRTGPAQEAVEQIKGNIDHASPYSVLAGRTFDVVCQFLAFNTEAIERDIEAFAGKCQHYIFISSAAVYQKPCREIVTETTSIGNPYWEYGRQKAACEALLMEAHEAGRLPVTIVRPSHTYRTRLPGTVLHGDHQAWRILNGKPIIVHDDGQSLWTLTHASDFARAFVLLCANPKTLGEAYHITDDQAHTWNAILGAVGEALGKAPLLRHISSDTLIHHNQNWLGPLRGDKSNALVFDNSKIRSALGGWRCEMPLMDGLQLAASHTVQNLNTGYTPDADVDALVDQIIREHDSIAL